MRSGFWSALKSLKKISKFIFIFFLIISTTKSSSTGDRHLANEISYLKLGCQRGKTQSWTVKNQNGTVSLLGNRTKEALHWLYLIIFISTRHEVQNKILQKLISLHMPSHVASWPLHVLFAIQFLTVDPLSINPLSQWKRNLFGNVV